MSQPYGAPNPYAADPGPVFVVQIPGYDAQPVGIFQLRNWAMAKQIQSNTLVTDSRNGTTYQAAQIPGIFSDKEYMVALLFSIFLGYFGIDRFYTGQVGAGVGKLLTAGGCGIWWLIDVILYATRGVSDSNGLPLK